eukprot:CFRG3972T1
MGGVLLGMDTYIPWEYQFTEKDGPPIRSIVPPFVVAGLPMLLLKSCKLYGPNLLLVYPRVVCLFLSLFQERILASLCRSINADPWPILLTSALSHVVWVFHTRTFSNSVESFLVSVGIWLIIRTREKAYNTPRRSSALTDIALGLTIAIGVFNRFTYMIFTIPLAIAWIYINIHSSSTCGSSISMAVLRTFITGVIRVVLPSVCLCLVLVAIDTAYYIGPSKLTEIAISMNKYTVDSSDQFRYFLRVYVLPCIIQLADDMQEMGVRVDTSGVGEVSARWGVGPHQEARFLMPLLTPMLMLTPTRAFADMKWAIPSFLLFNCLLGGFFAYVHQAGVVPSLLFLHDDVISRSIEGCLAFTIVYFHTYMPPRFLLLNEQFDSLNITMIDLGGEDVDKLLNTVDSWSQENYPLEDKYTGDNAHTHRETVLHPNPEELTTGFSTLLPNINVEQCRTIYVVLPGSMAGTISAMLERTSVSFTSIASFFPHWSGEEPPRFSTDDDWDTIEKQASLYVYASTTDACQHVQLTHV